MHLEEFVGRYGGVYEHSPWVAESIFSDDVCTMKGIELAPLLAACVDSATDDRKLALIRAHPDLAGRAAISGELTEASTDEQSSAGIDQCTPEEFARFRDLNSRYKEKFSFPFVMAVRDSNRHEILTAFAERLLNDPHTEFNKAITEIHKIARLRLEAMEEQ